MWMHQFKINNAQEDNENRSRISIQEKHLHSWTIEIFPSLIKSQLNEMI